MGTLPCKNGVGVGQGELPPWLKPLELPDELVNSDLDVETGGWGVGVAGCLDPMKESSSVWTFGLLAEAHRCLIFTF